MVLLQQLLILILCLLSQSTIWSGSLKNQKNNDGFGVLIDGGSSSTKVKIYRWKSSNDNKLIPTIDLFKSAQFTPGVQTFYSEWKNLTTYLANILNWAQKTLPENKHSDTPIYMMATAGVRTLNIEEASILFDHIRQYLASGPFIFRPEWASVLSGEEEGVYSWIAVNYLLGFFDSYNPVNKSVGLLEMGGASMQITFIPRDPLYAEEFQVIIAGTKYQLYAQSYMKYGASAIKERIADLIARENGARNDLNNPCMLKGDKTSIKLESGSSYSMKGTGSATECKVLLERILQPNKGYGCQPKPCAIGSVYQPNVADMLFYATQAFTFTPNTLKVLGNDSILRLDVLEQAANKYCNLNIKEVIKPKYASDDCLMGLYIPTLFIKSYGFSSTTTNIKVTNNIGNQTIDWSLGVMLIELSSRFTRDSSGKNYAVTCPSDVSMSVTHDYVRSNSASLHSSVLVLAFCNLMYLYLYVFQYKTFKKIKCS